MRATLAGQRVDVRLQFTVLLLTGENTGPEAELVGERVFHALVHERAGVGEVRHVGDGSLSAGDGLLGFVVYKRPRAGELASQRAAGEHGLLLVFAAKPLRASVAHVL